MSEAETAVEELIEKEDAAESMDGDGTQRQRDRDITTKRMLRT